jgi:hypothetical protein
MARELKPCGTIAAYQRHLKHSEQACPACLQAVRDRDAQQKQARQDQATTAP